MDVITNYQSHVCGSAYWSSVSSLDELQPVYERWWEAGRGIYVAPRDTNTSTWLSHYSHSTQPLLWITHRIV